MIFVYIQIYFAARKRARRHVPKKPPIASPSKYKTSAAALNNIPNTQTQLKTISPKNSKMALPTMKSSVTPNLQAQQDEISSKNCDTLTPKVVTTALIEQPIVEQLTKDKQMNTGYIQNGNVNNNDNICSRNNLDSLSDSVRLTKENNFKNSESKTDIIKENTNCRSSISSGKSDSINCSSHSVEKNHNEKVIFCKTNCLFLNRTSIDLPWADESDYEDTIIADNTFDLKLSDILEKEATQRRGESNSDPISKNSQEIEVEKEEKTDKNITEVVLGPVLNTDPVTEKIETPQKETIRTITSNGSVGRIKSPQAQMEAEPSSSDSGTAVKKLKFKFTGRKNSKANREMIDIGRMKQKDHEKERKRIARNKETRATLIIGLIMGAFILSWLPFFLMYVLGALCPDCYIAPWGFAIAFWVGYSNSALNPIIYTIFNNDFRKAFRKILFK